MLCLMRVRITSVAETFKVSARSLTIICGGSEIGPVGFSFTGAARRSWLRAVLLLERAAGLAPGVLPVRFCTPGRVLGELERPEPADRVPVVAGRPGRPLLAAVPSVCCAGRCAVWLAVPLCGGRFCGERCW